jgi:hypothetical protein
VGGGFVSFLSLIAEKVPEKYSGLVLSLPSTVAISFFFLGWILSSEKIAQVVPTVIVSLGIMLLLIVTYVYLSKLHFQKGLSIFVCTVGSVIVWLALSIPLAVIKFSNFALSIGTYLFLSIFSYLLFSLSSKQKTKIIKLSYTFKQKIARAVFAGLIISLSIFLAKILGPFWGGIFSVFPATFLSTLIIFHWYYDSDFLAQISRSIPQGSLILVSFVIAAKYTFLNYGILWGLILAYVASLVSFFILLQIMGYRNEKAGI